MSVPQPATTAASSGAVTIAPTADGLTLTGPAVLVDRIHLSLSPEWRAGQAEDADEFVWDLPGRARFRFRVRRAPAFGVDADLHNLTDDVAHLDSPRLVLTSVEPVVAWLAGSAGEVIVADPDGALVLTQRRGACSSVSDPRGVGVALFQQPVLLRAGQAVGSTWVTSSVPAGRVPPEAAWLPVQRYVEVGEPVELEFPDGAIVAPGLRATTDPVDARTSLAGPPGLHSVTLVDARGSSSFEVGWFRPLPEQVADALAVPDLPADLEAWLRAFSLVDQDLDALDVALGRALESPSLWGLLAGLRVAAFTDLPVDADLREAARGLVAEQPRSEAIPILAAHSLRLGQDLGLADELFYPPPGPLPEAWRLLGGPGDVSQQLLADVEFGRVSSEPPRYGGRQVALAELWLASRPDSAVHVELGLAVDRARRRLMAAMSGQPDPRELAWLLVAHGLG